MSSEQVVEIKAEVNLYKPLLIVNKFLYNAVKEILLELVFNRGYNAPDGTYSLYPSVVLSLREELSLNTEYAERISSESYKLLQLLVEQLLEGGIDGE